MKWCNKCKQGLDDSMFYRRGTSLHSECKRCAAARTRAWKAANQEKAAAYQAAYYAENREKVAARSRAWYAANRERALAYFAAYQAANPEKMQAASARRRACKLKQFVEDVDRRELLRMYNGFCGICGEPIEGTFHVDHEVPLSKGGEHSYANCQPAHPVCNMKKSDKMPTKAICDTMELDAQTTTGE